MDSNDKDVVIDFEPVRLAIKEKEGDFPTNSKMAEVAGMSYQGLNKLEKNVNQRTATALKKLAEWAGISLDEIVKYK
jgi:transcriptional regulator with XRE-family HTH domain